MTAIHAGPLHGHDDNACDWRHDSFGQHLRCDDKPVPGSLYCTGHLIARLAYALDRPEIVTGETAA